MNKVEYNELKIKRRFCLKKFNEKSIKSILLNENNCIVRDKKELTNYVIEALSNNSVNKNLHLGIISNKTIMKIKKNITEIKYDKIDSLFQDDIEYALVIN